MQSCRVVIDGIDDVPSGISQIALDDGILDTDCAVARGLTAQKINAEAVQSEDSAVEDTDSLAGGAAQVPDRHVVEDSVKAALGLLMLDQAGWLEACLQHKLCHKAD